MTPKKKKKETPEPSEIPVPANPEIEPGSVPEEPVSPQEEPETLPEKEPDETKPPPELPEKTELLDGTFYKHSIRKIFLQKARHAGEIIFIEVRDLFIKKNTLLLANICHHPD